MFESGVAWSFPTTWHPSRAAEADIRLFLMSYTTYHCTRLVLSRLVNLVSKHYLCSDLIKTCLQATTALYTSVSLSSCM